MQRFVPPSLAFVAAHVLLVGAVVALASILR
jgi:hypothetical protein